MCNLIEHNARSIPGKASKSLLRYFAVKCYDIRKVSLSVRSVGQLLKSRLNASSYVLVEDATLAFAMKFNSFSFILNAIFISINTNCKQTQTHPHFEMIQRYSWLQK